MDEYITSDGKHFSDKQDAVQHLNCKYWTNMKQIQARLIVQGQQMDALSALHQELYALAEAAAIYRELVHMREQP